MAKDLWPDGADTLNAMKFAKFPVLSGHETPKTYSRRGTSATG